MFPTRLKGLAAASPPLALLVRMKTTNIHPVPALPLCEGQGEGGGWERDGRGERSGGGGTDGGDSNLSQEHPPASSLFFPASLLYSTPAGFLQVRQTTLRIQRTNKFTCFGFLLSLT